MKVYLAARWDRASEMRAYADELRKLGVTVCGTWIYATNPDGTKVEWSMSDPEQALAYGRKEAERDIDEINESDLVVNFTEDPKTAWVRGGRHWECGYAYAIGVDQLIVGPNEVVFHCMADMDRVDTWEEAKAYIVQYKEDFHL